MTEFGLDIIADGILTNYLVGIAAFNRRKDMMITRLDASGDIESYAVLPEIRWVWGPGGEETGNTAFGAAYSYYGSGTSRLFFIANNGWGIFEMVRVTADGAPRRTTVPYDWPPVCPILSEPLYNNLPRRLYPSVLCCAVVRCNALVPRCFGALMHWKLTQTFCFLHRNCPSPFQTPAGTPQVDSRRPPTP